MANKDITPEELDRMRAIVEEHDGPRPVAVMDINNPPKVPYVFQPFPATVYRPKERKEQKGEKAPKEWENAIVKDEKELKEHLSKGWKKEAPPPDDAEAESPAEHEKAPVPATAKK